MFLLVRSMVNGLVHEMNKLSLETTEDIRSKFGVSRAALYHSLMVFEIPKPCERWRKAFCLFNARLKAWLEPSGFGISHHLVRIWRGVFVCRNTIS